MKIQVHADALIRAVATVSSIVPTKPDHPAIGGVKLLAKKGELTAFGTDRNVFLRFKIAGVEVEEDGAVVIAADRLHAILKELKGQKIQIEAEEDKGCVLESATAKFNMRCVSANEFPNFPKLTHDDGATLPGKKLIEMVNRVSFACAQHQGRFAMNGVMFELRDNYLRLVATDSKRLAMVEKKLPTTVKAERQVVVPAEGLKLLSKLLAESDEQFSIKLDAIWITLRSKTATMAARLICGGFPPYEMVFKMTPKTFVDVNREGLLSALKQASLITSKEYKAVRLQFSSKGLLLLSKSPEAGTSTVEFNDLEWKHPDCKVACNVDYLIENLKSINTEKVRVLVADAKTPVFFKRLISKDDGRFVAEKNSFCLVVPLSLE